MSAEAREHIDEPDPSGRQANPVGQSCGTSQTDRPSIDGPKSDIYRHPDGSTAGGSLECPKAILAAEGVPEDAERVWPVYTNGVLSIAYE